MEVKKDRVVLFHYSITEDGKDHVVETNNNAIPFASLHGHGNTLRGLEEAIEGKSAGDSVSVRLSPEQAYGPRNENASQKVPIKHLASKHKRLMPGTIVKLNTDKGLVDASVIKAGKFMVTLDLNHPFAGKSLVFHIDIKSVREATPEELAHGHAHGEGGHKH